MRNNIRKMIFLFLFLFLQLFFIYGSEINENGDLLLERIEEKNMSDLSNIKFKWSLTVKYSDGYINQSKFLAYKSKFTKFMFFTYLPESSYGKVYLRIENAIWQYYPLADTTIRTNYKSLILDSGLTYFDIMFDELSQYYTASVDENITNISYENMDINCIKLMLFPKIKLDNGYGKIDLYVNKSTLAPMVREYYTVSGKLIKKIIYKNIKYNDNKISSFDMEISNILTPNKNTYASFFDITEIKNISDNFFTINFLKSWTPTEDELK